MTGRDQEAIIERGELSVHYASSRCIHARFCVLQAPAVFLAEAEDDPDRTADAQVTAVIRRCPSGALSYSTTRAELQEAPPPVNAVWLRENGPYAINAHILLAGEDAPSTRRTLCRCGASSNKPYCDMSHIAIGFVATGEPPARNTTPLDVQAGPLTVTPLRDGPLKLEGPAEVVGGSGRVVSRETSCLLCRCGGSHTKPFCDGSHLRLGFTDAADGTPTPTKTPAVPSLAEWVGGRKAIGRLIEAFYGRVPEDPLLAPVFAEMSPEHVEHVADFVTEVLGGDPLYTRAGGSHAGMVRRHLGRHLSEAQRRRWVEMLVETADSLGWPDDPEFRAAFVGYLEWGSRLAVINSQDGAAAPPDSMPMPRWGWGPPGGPWPSGRGD